jgi:4-amino-4-deoxy-L-arabinose transferase-like glycosyltransferase
MPGWADTEFRTALVVFLAVFVVTAIYSLAKGIGLENAALSAAFIAALADILIWFGVKKVRNEP